MQKTNNIVIHKNTYPRHMTINGIEWKEVPDLDLTKTHKGLFASNTGHVDYVTNNGTYITNKHTTTKTYTNEYVTVSVWNNTLSKHATKSLHRLVCSAWHGPSPFEGAVVNHKDGDKHNNKPYNLEWLSNRDNIRHAVETGLMDNVHTYTKWNPETNETFIIRSSKALAKDMGISRSSGDSRIYALDGKRWRNGYIYYVNYMSLKHTPASEKDIVVKNFDNKIIHIYRDLRDACLSTKTAYYFAKSALNTGKVVNGLLMYTLSNRPNRWPKIFKKDISDSKVQHNKYVYGVCCLDMLTGEKIYSDNATAMSDSLKNKRPVSRKTIDKYINKEKLELCNGYQFMVNDGCVSIPEYTKEEVKASIDNWVSDEHGYWKAYDVISDEMSDAGLLSEVLRWCGDKIGKVMYDRTVRGNKEPLYAGFVIVDEEEDPKAHGYTVKEAYASRDKYVRGVNTQSKETVAIDMLTNNVYIADSARSLVKKISMIRPTNISSVEKMLRKGGGLTNGWHVEYGCISSMKPVWSKKEIERSMAIAKGISPTGKRCRAVKGNKVIEADTAVVLSTKLIDLGYKCGRSAVTSRLNNKKMSALDGWIISKVV